MRFWTKKVLAAAVVAAVGFGGIARAGDAQNDLADEVRKLREEVKQLKERQQSSVDATLDAVKKDAEKRSDLFGAEVAGPQGGWDKAFFLMSPNKDYTMKLGLIIQARGVATFREGVKAGGDDDIQAGGEIRRAKPIFEGNAFGEDITYKLQLTNGRDAAPINLDDAWIAYQLNKEWNIRIGQFKNPGSWEESGVGDTDQLAAERSLLNEVIGQNAPGARTQGILATWKAFGDTARIQGMISDGEGAANTDFRDQVTPNTRARIGLHGRVDYKVFGDWKNHSLLTAKGTNDKNTLVLGASIGWTDFVGAAVYRGEAVGHYTLGSNWNFFGGVTYAITDTRVAGADSRFDWGPLLQAGYLFNSKYEVFGRASAVFQDDEFVATDDVLSEFTIGVNRYLGKDGIAGNNARITVDLNYLPAGPGADRTGLGYLANGGRNEFTLRTQFQLKI